MNNLILRYLRLVFNFKLNKKFKTVLVPFRGIQFITNPKEQLQALKCFAKHLQNRGFLILDAFNPDINKLTGKHIFKGRKTLYNCLEGEKLAVVEKLKNICYIKQLITVEENYMVTAPGRVPDSYTHTYTMRYSFRYEIEYMLRLAGFTINNIFLDFHGTTWGNDDAENIVIVAQKNNKTITR